MSLIILVEKFNLDNLQSKPGCQVVSKAFWISKNTAAADILLLKFKVTWSASLTHCKVVLWHARKPEWLALSKRFFLMCFCAICKITFSKSLPVEGSRPIGRKFWGNLGPLSGFGMATTFAPFQNAWKCESRTQWLIKWLKWANGLLGRCLRHLFGIPSIPQAFFNV
jgi:hypothetical protein